MMFKICSTVIAWSAISFLYLLNFSRFFFVCSSLPLFVGYEVGHVGVDKSAQNKFSEPRETQVIMGLQCNFAYLCFASFAMHTDMGFSPVETTQSDYYFKPSVSTPMYAKLIAYVVYAVSMK